jgi:hypothetical protein|tara:strand:- start:418 stop:1509 length:1092 start_codon:yes stop_codon:yes gene_type:complete
MAVDFKTFLHVAPHVTAIKKPILIRGRHGVGKSEVVYQFAENIGYSVVERRASQMTEGDLVGLPKTDGNVTSFCPPDWFTTACESPVVLFLDEVDRATIEVRQGIFELTDSRKLNGHRLHPETLIFAAINGGEHGAQYQVGEMDPAELDRWTVFDVEPTVEDWLSWAQGNVHKMVWDFINQNRVHLEHKDEFEPNKVYPSRRSWDRFNECMVSGEFLEQGASPEVFNLASAFLGFEAAVSFNDFVQNYDRQVSIHDVVTDGKLELVEDWGINDHTAFVEKLESSKMFAEALKEEQVQNLAAYFFGLPSEVAMKLWTVLGASENDINNTIRLHQAKVDGVPVSQRMVEMLQADDGKKDEEDTKK